MFGRLKGLLRGVACAALGLHTTADLRMATRLVETSWRQVEEGHLVEIERLTVALKRAQPRKISKAVAAVACPRCGALPGDRCRGKGGETLRRTHGARSVAWRAEEKR